MKYLTVLNDHKINAKNHLIETNIREYVKIATPILANNIYQRRRVLKSSSIFSMLKEDLQVGCVLPPIVLAFFPKGTDDFPIDLSEKELMLKLSTPSNDIIILDGLQRSYTIIDLLKEIGRNPPLRDKINELPLRIEVYTGISKIGVLYRMLTLNTGQTPMSTRHQIEILYHDYKEGVDGIKFIAETEQIVPSSEEEYKFSDILDGFLSYITGNYFPIDRDDLVDTIRNLEKVTKQDKQKDVFKLLVKAYDNLRKKLKQLSNDFQYNTSFDNPIKRPFAKNIDELFKKVQVIAGFGAAINFLIEKDLLSEIEGINELTSQLILSEVEESFGVLVKNLNYIQLNAKKIGNEQRMYFYYLIRSLFNKNNDSFLNFDNAVIEGFQLYRSNTL